MNRREFAVLDALNIASTRHSYWNPKTRVHRYQATAEQIAATLADDERLQEYDLRLTSRQVGATLGAMAHRERGKYSELPEFLVERVGTRRWRLADGGLKALML